MFAGDPWWAWGLDPEDRAVALGTVRAMLTSTEPGLLGMRWRELLAFLARSGLTKSGG